MKMDTIIKKWTKEEKDNMMKISGEVFDILKRLKDPMMMANVTYILNESIRDMYGFDKVFTANKEKKIISHEEIKNVLNIAYGMVSSDINVVLFRDNPEVWMQYYMGMHLGKKTYIIIREEDAKENTIIRLQGKIIKVREFTNDELDKAVKQINDEVKKTNV